MKKTDLENPSMATWPWGASFDEESTSLGVYEKQYRRTSFLNAYLILDRALEKRAHIGLEQAARLLYLIDLSIDLKSVRAWPKPSDWSRLYSCTIL